jgi:hypothetical protein
MAMKTLLGIFTLLAALLFQAPPTSTSQTPAATTPQTPRPGIAIPFPEGEKLIFEVKFSRFPIYATLGTVTFEHLGVPSSLEIKGATLNYKPAEDENLIALRAVVDSKGILVNLFGLDVKNRYEALVNRRDFSARLSLKEAIESKKHITTSALFDPLLRMVIYNIVDLNRPQVQLPSKQLERKDGMQSLLSAFYYVRLQALTDGQLICLPVSEEEENYIFEIQVHAREVVDLEKTKIATVKVEPKLFGPGRFLNREGELTLWYTDDERHIPVRLQAKTSAGTLTATLTNFDSQPPPKTIMRSTPSN